MRKKLYRQTKGKINSKFRADCRAHFLVIYGDGDDDDDHILQFELPFSSLHVTVLSLCCQIGLHCSFGALQNIVDHFRFSLLSWSYELFVPAKWLRHALYRREGLGASAAIVTPLFRLCTSGWCCSGSEMRMLISSWKNRAFFTIRIRQQDLNVSLNL